MVRYANHHSITAPVFLWCLNTSLVLNPHPNTGLVRSNWMVVWIPNRLTNGLLVEFTGHYLKTGPFTNQTCLDHSNTGVCRRQRVKVLKKVCKGTKQNKKKELLLVRNWYTGFKIPQQEYSGDLNIVLVWYSNGPKLSEGPVVQYSSVIWIPD